MILALFYNAMLILTSGYAFVRGGRPERIGALACLLGSWGTAVLRALLPAEWLPAAIPVAMIDVTITATFFWLAVTTIRFWPIWAFGFALADIAVTIIGAVLPRIQLFAFHTGLGAYAYLVLGAIAVGTYRLGRNPDPIVRNGSRTLWLRTRDGAMR